MALPSRNRRSTTYKLIGLARRALYPTYSCSVISFVLVPVRVLVKLVVALSLIMLALVVPETARPRREPSVLHIAPVIVVVARLAEIAHAVADAANRSADGAAGQSQLH